MGWNKREAVSNLVILGDEEGNKRIVGGLLVGMPHDRTYPDKVNYEIILKDGESVLLSGSASLSRQINDGDLGKFIKCEFEGWGKSANGKFKIIAVNVWEGDPTPDMKAWPGYADFHKPKPVTPKAAPVAAGGRDDFDDFKKRVEDDDDSDLPF